MKRLILLFACLFTWSVVTWASHDKPIQVGELPKQAQTFIKNHFPNLTVALAKMETDFMSRSYDVIFTNGDKVEFDKKGKWTSVECEHSVVPAAIVPEVIKGYVDKQYPGATILKIEITDRKGYEIELSNGIDIEFDKKLNVIEIDR